ncbi:hypothetical protein [Mycoplasma sp. P36-A1]
MSIIFDVQTHALHKHLNIALVIAIAITTIALICCSIYNYHKEKKVK